MEQRYHNINKSTALGGINKFLKGLKQRKKGLKYLLSNRTYTIHKPKRVKYQTRPVTVLKINYQLQSDIVDLTRLKEFNNGYRYILTVIDCFSKYGYAMPQKTKNSKETAENFEKIVKKNPPTYLQTDRDKSYMSQNFQNILDKYNIKLFHTNTKLKASICERFNRTLMTLLSRYLTYKNTYKWFDILPDIIKHYNNSTHRSIGVAPAKVNRNNEHSIRLKLQTNRSFKGIWKKNRF